MEVNVPVIGKPVPSFEARTTNGNVRFPEDYKGKWVILYSYIGDFLPISALDILAFDEAQSRLSAYNTDVIAMSADSIADHLAWVLQLRNMRTDGCDITLPLISDRNFAIAQKYGIINANDDTRNNERSVFIIDPNGILRGAHRYQYNMGVNIRELERELLALQSGQYQFAQVSGEWTPGDDIVEYPPQTVEGLNRNREELEVNGIRCIDWYICFRPDSGKRRPSQTVPPPSGNTDGGAASIG